MARSQPSPFVIQSQMYVNDEVDEVALLRKVAPRVPIARSNSAPHAHNRSGSSKQDVKSKVVASCESAGSQKKEFSLDHNIPTLSDGVIQVNDEQGAACNLSSRELLTEYPTGNGTSDLSTPLSSTPLCDTNHSPSSTKRYYEKTSPVFSPRTGPENVRQRREKSFSFDLGSNHFMPKHFSAEKTVVHQGQNVNSSQGNGGISSAGQIVMNGVYVSENGTSEAYDTSEANEHQTSSNWHDSDIRRHHQPLVHPRQVKSEIIHSKRPRKITLANVKDLGYARLEEELLKAQKALEMKDEEVDELKGIRERLMKEVSDFTASLFEEVNSQLNEAAVSEQQARKQLKEASAEIEVLTAEVAALKDLVLTSTPSSPNKHLHPQIDNSAKKDKPFWKTHRRSTSHHQFTKESREKAEASESHSLLKELDTVAFDEFQRWRLQPTMEFTGQFFARVQQEDIQPCLNFKNTKLAERLLQGVKSNSLSIEPIPGDHSYPRKCCLSETHKLCNYKIRFEGDDEWYSISQMSRNRIIAVCDFYTYLRYIVQGLVKCSDKDMFAELVRMRNQMAQARLGLI